MEKFNEALVKNLFDEILALCKLNDINFHYTSSYSTNSKYLNLSNDEASIKFRLSDHSKPYYNRSKCRFIVDRYSYLKDIDKLLSEMEDNFKLDTLPLRKLISDNSSSHPD